MPSNIKILLLVSLIFFNCKNDSSLILSSKSFSEEYHGDCNGNDCAQVTIDYIKINEDNEIADKINFTVGSSIIYFLNSSLERNIKSTTISEASELFIKTYENDKKEFPELSPYFAEISVINSFSSSEILSLKTEFYTFTGGAHGNGSTKFLNFDPTTGALVSNKSLIKNEKEFTDFVEVLFRKENNIDPSKNINSTGFWFENDIFYLPESIGFTETDMLLIYNQYEIASYAEGQIVLLIPLKKALPYLSF